MKKTFKKYANRKYYDIDTSKYVNLDDIITMVKMGTNVKIIESKSGKDITTESLLSGLTRRAKSFQNVEIVNSFIRDNIYDN